MTEAEVLNLVNDEALIELTKELVRIPSENPPGNEQEAALHIKDWLEQRNLEVEVIEAEENRPNLVAEYGAQEGPVFMLNGHTDVVPPGDGWTVDPYGGVVQEGKLYGRGAADMKGGIAAMLHAFDAIRRSRVRLRGKLLLVVTVDEETGGRAGAAHLVSRGHVCADSCLVCEPSSLMLVTAEGGLVWPELTVTGKSVHSVLAQDGVNAVEKLLSVLQSLLPIKRWVEGHVGVRGKPSIFTINVIEGGAKVNQVPGRCRASIDVRIPPGVEISPTQVLEAVQETVAECRDKDPELDLDLSYRDPVEPFEIPPDSPIIATLSEAVEAVTGKPAQQWRPQQLIKTDDSDLYHWWTRGQIPGVYFGPGAIEQAHNADEYVELEELRQAARIYALVALRTLGWEER
jgi:acetylornithine deacetylase/succinyl-diaminopimelate desuccinylase family protein